MGIGIGDIPGWIGVAFTVGGAIVAGVGMAIRGAFKAGSLNETIKGFGAQLKQHTEQAAKANEDIKTEVGTVRQDMAKGFQAVDERFHQADDARTRMGGALHSITETIRAEAGKVSGKVGQLGERVSALEGADRWNGKDRRQA